MIPPNILGLSVSFQENSWSGLSKQLTIFESLTLIKNGDYAPFINRLRRFLAIGDQDSYGREKRRLPAVTFAASFAGKRNRQSIFVYNQILVIDIDKLESNKLIEIKESFKKEPYIISFWESPSGSGIKGLIHLTFSADFKEVDTNFKHSYGFKMVSNYIQYKYKILIDPSGKDVTRLCFFSYDSNILIKDSFKSFDVIYTGEEAEIIKQELQSSIYTYSAFATKDQKFNPKGKNKQSDRSIVQSIIKFLTKKNLSITKDFDNWYKIAYAISNTFTHDIGLKYFISLSRLDRKKFNLKECEDITEYCYANTQGKIKFATIIRFAKQKGYKEGKGVPKVVSLL